MKMYCVTSEDWNNGLEAVGYEIDQLGVIFNLLVAEDPHENRANSYLEAFLLHVRNLWEFYSNKERYKDTMLCSDYIQRDKLSCQDDLGGDAKYKKRLDKWLAHLTYSRPSLGCPNKDWPVRYMFIQLANLSIEFYELLVETDEFTGQTREIEEEAWCKRKADLEELLKEARKELPLKGYMNADGCMSSTSTTTMIQVNQFLPPLQTTN